MMLVEQNVHKREGGEYKCNYVNVYVNEESIVYSI